MITGFFALVLLVPVIAGAGNGEWGVVGVSVALIVLLLAIGAAGRKETRAWSNRTEYWSKSGKDRAKLRHQWEAQARREEEEERARLRAKRIAKEEKRRRREMQAEAEALGISVEEYEAKVYAEQERAEREEREREKRARDARQYERELITCRHCGKEVYAKRMWMPLEEGKIKFYMCPECHLQTYVVLRKQE